MSYRPAPVTVGEQARALVLELADITDPAAIAQKSQEALTCLDAVREWLTGERLSAVQDLREQDPGLSLSQLAALLNISKSRAQQLVEVTKKDAPPHEPFSRPGSQTQEPKKAKKAATKG